MDIPYFIPDTSPLFAYSPCVDCAEGASWESAYSDRGDGYDETFHMTSTGSMGSSSISFNISGAANILLHSDALPSGGDCGARYSLDGGDYTPGCAFDLSPGIHQVQIKATSDGPFSFRGISGHLHVGTGGNSKRSYTNHTIDDLSPEFTHTGPWTMISRQGVVGIPGNDTVATQYGGGDDNGGISHFFNSSGSITTVQGAAVKLSFTGAGLYVYGMSGPEGGSADVQLDGTLTNMLNLTNPWRAYSSLLYFTTGLNESEPHEISLINTTPGRQLVIDYAVVTTSADGTSTDLNLGLIIGIIGGASALVLILAVLTYLCFVRRRHRKRSSGPSRGLITPYGFSTKGGYRDLHSAKATSIDSWRKNAAGGTGGGAVTPSSASSTDSPHNDAGRYLPHSQPTRQLQSYGHSPGRSPPPEYPEYIPYNGPIEPPPSPSEDGSEDRGVHQVMLGGSASPSAITGINPSTQGWLTRTKSSIGSPKSRRDGRSPRSDIRKPSPIPLRDRNGDHGGDGELVSLESYRLHPDVLTPTSTLSPASLDGTTIRAMGGMRSIARLYPTATATATAIANGNGIGVQMGMDVPRSPPETSLPSSYTSETSLSFPRPVLIPSESSHYTSNDTHLHHTNSTSNRGTTRTQTPNTATSTQDYSNLATRTDSASGMIPSLPPSLRRGVSIKSVKTIRSFFSGLLSQTFSSDRDTPAVPPSAYFYPLETPAARPDSDIFPGGNLSRANSTITTRTAFTTTTGATTMGRAPSLPRRVKSKTSSKVSHWQRNRYGIEPPPIMRIDTARTAGTTNNTGAGAGNTGDMSGNMFIELDPNSPVTMFAESRRGSEMPSSWRSVV